MDGGYRRRPGVRPPWAQPLLRPQDGLQAELAPQDAQGPARQSGHRGRRLCAGVGAPAAARHSSNGEEQGEGVRLAQPLRLVPHTHTTAVRKSPRYARRLRQMAALKFIVLRRFAAAPCRKRSLRDRVSAQPLIFRKALDLTRLLRPRRARSGGVPDTRHRRIHHPVCFASGVMLD